MKKVFTLQALFCLFIFFAQNLWAQTPSVEKYSIIKIYLQPGTLQRLNAKGVYFDEGEMVKDKYFISAFSAWEISQIKAAGAKYDVLVDDAAKEFEQRNAEDIKLHPNPKEEAAKAASVNCNYPTPSMFNLGSMGGYLKYEEILAALDTMHARYPNLCSAKTPISATQKTWEGRPLYYVKISDNVNTNESAEPKVLYTGLHHAREGLSMMNLIFFMDYILENYTKNADAKKIVDGCELYFVPCVNPDGYVHNQTTNPNGGGMWRKNRRSDSQGKSGVDLNRNYGYQWGLASGSSGSQGSDTYRGPSAFSEPESQLIKSFAIQKKFIASIHHHSYAKILFYPWDYTNTNCPEATLFKRIGDSMTLCNHYSVEHGAGSLGYLASGTTPDWMYGDVTSKPKSYSFTNEIGGNSFWPSRSQIIPLCQEQVWENIRLALFALDISKQPMATTLPKSVIPLNSKIISAEQ